MQARCGWSFTLGLMLAMPSMAMLSMTVRGAEVLAEPPSDISVTVYRAPFRSGGSIQLNNLNGFALISETRTVRLPAGENRIRFDGVADGIEPVSAIVTGFNGEVIEKNRDAKLLSPAALVASALGRTVELVRSNRRTGRTEALAGTILSDADGGVVFQSAEGIEGLRCSGLPETFSFSNSEDLSARPTLSVLVRTPRAVTQQITLSYLARGFDWAADYTATLAADQKTLNLGAWVTLANSNGTGFPAARTQVVAGRVNRESGQVEPIDFGGPILAVCWPRGSTSDQPMVLAIVGASRSLGSDSMTHFMAAAPMMALKKTEARETTVQQEQLGDLKLYRVPDRTTVASRQSKQVRLLDRSAIPVATVYSADLVADQTFAAPTVHRLLRTMNTVADHLGLPLPSGTIALFGSHDGQTLLEHEADLRDIASGEEVEIDAGRSADVRVDTSKESVTTEGTRAEVLPWVPGVALRTVNLDHVSRVLISNARNAAIEFELRVQLVDGATIIRADRPLGVKNGRPLFKLTIPANGSVTVRYQTQKTQSSAIPVR